ncbi:DUF692 family protein [bacterium]|nr:DUF692 family protein [bacterium]
MKFAVNFSNPLVRLIEEGDVELDLIKCPDWEGMLQEAAPHRPVTIHFSLDAGLGKTLDADFSRIEHFLQTTRTPHVNSHLVTPRSCSPDDPTELRRVNDLWRQEIGLMVEHFGSERVVLEHYPYTLAAPHIAPAADVSAFSSVIDDTDCQLLVDLSHARITADTLGVDVKDYIGEMPLERLAELHVTGVRPYGGVLTDHFGMDEEGWQVFEWALQEIHAGHWREPRVVAFEYGGVGDVFVWRTDYDVLKEQVPRLYGMVHANGR